MTTGVFQGLSCRVTGETSYVFCNHDRFVTSVDILSSPLSVREFSWAPPYVKFLYLPLFVEEYGSAGLRRPSNIFFNGIHRKKCSIVVEEEEPENTDTTQDECCVGGGGVVARTRPYIWLRLDVDRFWEHISHRRHVSIDI